MLSRRIQLSNSSNCSRLSRKNKWRSSGCPLFYRLSPFLKAVPFFRLSPFLSVPTGAPATTGTNVQASVPATTGTRVQTGVPGTTSNAGAVSPNTAIVSKKDAVQTRVNAGGKCEYCGVTTVPAQQRQAGVTPPANEGQTDHYIPRSQGGTDDPSNLVHACAACNIEKSDTMPQGTKWELPRMQQKP